MKLPQRVRRVLVVRESDGKPLKVIPTWWEEKYLSRAKGVDEGSIPAVSWIPASYWNEPCTIVFV